jgi:Carboxypeptidase regulatory-like domain/TonB-dependent Receptor Plug Domain
LLKTVTGLLFKTITQSSQRQTAQNDRGFKDLEVFRMGHDRNFSRRFKFFGCLTLISTCLLLLPCAFGQVDEGSITGLVQDPTGAVVPNAKVTLLNTDQGLSQTTNTDGSGVYTFSPVRIGNCSVSATAPGFSVTTQQHINVAVSQNVRVNVELKTGAATETVEVTTAPPQMQTEDASVGQVVNEQSVNNLPLNGRNFTFLAQLAAGVNTPQADTRGNAANGAFSANGLRPAQNNYLLDGIDNNSDNVDFLNGTNFVVLPPPDAIAEFKVQTSDFSAELGRAAGAVLNATVKSGTNEIHGDVWEFFRNDVLDAADWFEDNNGLKKGELRWNMFGGSIGGPVIKNKVFFFGDYQGFRHVQGNTQSGIAVPTVLQRNSGYTNLSELITAHVSSAAQADALGRMIPLGTVLDPATTRAVPGGYVRDPFGLATCTGATISLAACPGLNQIPADRIDPNAVKLLNLFPLPTTTGVSSNFAVSPNLYQHNNQFDVRGDYDLNDKNQVFARVSYWDNPQFIPGPFGGIADGGGFQQGIQTAKSFQGVAAYTHVFTPSTVNVARLGWDHLHTSRFGPEGSTYGIPAQYGIPGIPQVSENGGLPAFSFGGLQTLGSNNFLPSDETTQTTQVVDDLSKVYGAHSFKVGIEYQHVVFNTLQPAYSHGQFDYNGGFTDIPSNNGSTNGIAQFILPPTPASVPGGVDFSGGSDEVQASNINKTYDERAYFAAYFQDDWKVTPTLTLNLGLRWDYFGPINEQNGGQANFVPDGPNHSGVPTFIIPASGKDDRQLSSTANNPALDGTGFLDLLAKDGITLLSTDKYGKGLLKPQYNNFAPRFGFAYQVSPKLVARGGVGLFWNAFENQGYGPNIGENYPFVYNFNYVTKVPSTAPNGYSAVAPVSYQTPYSNCATAGPGQTASLESGFSCIGFTPLAVNASGLGLQGLQFNFVTPRTLAANLSFQYALTHSMSAQVAYVLTKADNLQVNAGANNVTGLLPYNASTTSVDADFPDAALLSPFPDFGGGSTGRMIGASIYNGLQTKVEKQFTSGLQFLLTYTFSKTMTDAGDLLNGGSLSGQRAIDVPGFGLRGDWSLASFNINNVFHFSGGYELPFGKNKKYFANANKMENALAGGWAINWITTLQGGQPLTLGCPTGTTAGTSCYDVTVPGQSAKLGIKIKPDASGKLTPYWLNNPAAFQQPCQMGDNGPVENSPAGCVPLTGFAVLGDRPGTTTGPSYHRFDFSTFKSIPINERFRMEFRGEFFNIVNHPNFNAPGFSGNGVVAIANSTNFNNTNFGALGSTRDAPNAPRQIQFSLKLYY